MGLHSRLPQQHLVKMCIASVMLLIGSLALWLMWLYTFSPLALATASVVICYGLSWLGYRIYHFWQQPQLDLIAFCQTKIEGESNITLQFANKTSLSQQLADAITSLSEQKQQPNTLNHALWQQVFNLWSTPLAIFDRQLDLLFCNLAFKQQYKHPILAKQNAHALGFKDQKNQLSHPDFQTPWHCSTLLHGEGEQQLWIFTATNIAMPLEQQRRQSQNDVIRILSHEIRNSLTPIASMSDTLLTAPNVPHIQQQEILERIKKRSESLLDFIHRYAMLSHLPLANPKRINLAHLCQQQAANLAIPLSYQGEHFATVDPLLFEQLVINLFKNAQQANNNTQLSCQCYFQDQAFILEIADQGPGFANLDNALNPLFTTKADGQGLGLALCRDIMNLHQGHIALSNHDTGARVTLSWPGATFQ